MNILQAIKERWSCRAYLDKTVEKEVIGKILNAAKCAPSGVNHQPWHVAVVTGKIKQAMSEEIIAVRRAGVKPHPDYNYYCEKFAEPFLERRKQCGIALYKAQDIKREDRERRDKVWEDNYYFFQAPVGIIFYIEGYLETGSWMDMGMFLQNVMLAAREFGLETVSQAAMAEYPDVVREHLHIADNFKIACGMSLGYPDLEAPVNNYRLERVSLDEFVSWY